MLREMNQLTEAKDAKIAEKKLPKNLRRRTGGTSASSVVLLGSRIEMRRCAGARILLLYKCRIRSLPWHSLWRNPRMQRRTRKEVI